MNKRDLTSSLTCLKTGRQSLVSCFCSEDHRLYRPMFSYKPNSNDMTVAICRYMLHWLGSHPVFFKESVTPAFATTSPDDNLEFDAFLRAYRNLCAKFVIGKSNSTGNASHAMDMVVTDSIRHLEEMLFISERTDNRLDILRYQSEKSKHLFDRLLNKLKEGSNDGG